METRNKRPIIKLPYTKNEIAIEIMSVALILISYFLIIAYWNKIPERIPTHFNIAGQVDNWGSKTTLIIMPVISTLMYVLLSVVRRFLHTANYIVPITEENAERQYKLSAEMLSWLKLEIIALSLYTEWLILQIALGKTPSMAPWFIPAFVLLTLITVGVYTYRSYKAK